MRTPVEVKLNERAPWVHGELTDERGYGHPVVVLKGERVVRGTLEVMLLRPLVGTDVELLEAAEKAGYVVLHAHATNAAHVAPGG
jgi:hypothetical protein